MIQAPPPSPAVLSTIVDAIVSVRGGKPEEAAQELTALFEVASSPALPQAFTDVYYVAHTALVLGLPGHISNPRLLELIGIAASEPISVSEPDWVVELYPQPHGRVSRQGPYQARTRSLPELLAHAWSCHSKAGQQWLADGVLGQIMSLALEDQIPDRELQAVVATVRTRCAQALHAAFAALQRGAPDEARRLARECERDCRSLGYLKGEIDAIHMRGRIEHESNNLQSAGECYRQALAMSERVHYEAAIAKAKHEQARIATVQGYFLDAEQGFRYARAYYAKQRDLANFSAAQNGLTVLAQRALDDPDAFLPSFDADKVPFGTPEQYLEVHSHAILAESNKWYRRRLLQIAIGAKPADPALARYAVEESRRTARIHDDAFVESLAGILLTPAPPLASPPPEPLRASPRLLRRTARFSTPETAAQSADELIDFLAGEHEPGFCVYRGQTREYSGPLLPSVFRGIIRPTDTCLDHSGPLFQYSLRKCGRRFYGEYNSKLAAAPGELFRSLPEAEADEARRVYRGAAINEMALTSQNLVFLAERRFLSWEDAVRQYLSPSGREIFEKYREAWKPHIDRYHRYCIRRAFLRPFGSALGMTLAQQFGLSSEALDATRSLDVAAFFASYDSARGFLSMPQEGVGIIYRFPCQPTDVRNRRINEYTYESLPSIVDTEDVLYRFERPGLALEDALRCFEVYAGAVYLDGVQDVELFVLPEGALRSSRITRQQSVMILPDEIWEPYEGPKPAGARVLPKRYIEDLAAREGMEKFYFRHTGRPPSSVRLRREDLWPRDDPFLAIIVAILSATYPLGAFIPDIMPLRLDLIDGGFDRDGFRDLCQNLALRHHIVVYDHNAARAASSGALVLRRLHM